MSKFGKGIGKGLLSRKPKSKVYRPQDGEFKYWKRYEEWERMDGTCIEVSKPLTGFKHVGKKPWQYYISEEDPITRGGKMLNREGTKAIMPLVEPVKDWHYYIGDTRSYSTMTAVPPNTLLGIGNPLLDMTIVTDQQFLNRFDLLPNNAIIAGEKQKDIYKIILAEFEPSYLPGGATQNSIRVAQWLLQTPRATTFFGSVGKDKFGEILKDTAESVGVDVRYEVVEGLVTGRCAAVITGEDRSLVTELGAASYFHPAFLDEQDNWKLVEKAQYYYIGGFFLPVSMETAMKLVKHAADNNKTVIMNLHATFLCQYFAENNADLMKYVDVLFGNGDEAAEFSKLMKFDTSDIKEMALKTAQLPKLNQSKNRMVVFTQGRDPTVVAVGDQVTQHDIDPIEPSLIKDTNGCGDAFVGGFLSQLAQGKSVSDCLRCGCYASKVVIQYFGCSYPDKPNF